LAGIGIGTGEKERILLEEMTKLSKHLVYYPMDISSELVQKAIQRVEHLPIEVMGIIGRFQDIENVASHWRHDIMISVLGNNFSNYHPDQFFGKLKSVVESDDLLLIDANLFPSTGNENAHRRRIEETYSSDLNKKFNISPLTKRGVPEAACEFDIQLKPTQSNWGTVYRTHKTIRILQDVSVDCGGREILLSQGDTIELGFTYKYTKEQILSLAPRFGFKVEQHYLNEDNTNILMLLSKETL
jgi:uncharacterized SAM-dependent methyltransferase